MADPPVVDAGTDEEGSQGPNGAHPADFPMIPLAVDGDDDDEDFELFDLDDEGDDDYDEDDEDDIDYEDEDAAFIPRYSSSDELESSESDAEAHEEKGPPLVLDDNSSLCHGIGSTVPHHQCCDALTVCPTYPDELVLTNQKHAVLYTVKDKALLAVEDLGFEPYSIARHKNFFAAGGDEAVKIYHIQPHSRGEGRKCFQLAAWFKVGNLQHRSGMNNGLRFGRCGSQVRLLVANQDGYVYVFNIPEEPDRTPGEASTSGRPPLSSKHWKAADFVCNNLRVGTRSADKPMQQVVWRTQEGNSVHSVEVVGRFKTPINCAAASPNGEFLSVVGDDTSVWLLDHASGYSMTMCTLPMQDRIDNDQKNRYHGCQYLTWDMSSTLLATSSDTLATVSVWSVKPASGQRKTPGKKKVHESALVERIFNFPKHARPCMALQFSPFDNNILFYVERSGRLHCIDTRWPSKGHQVIALKPHLHEQCKNAFVGCWAGHTVKEECTPACYKQWESEARLARDEPRSVELDLGLRLRGDWALRRITGLAVTRTAGVLVATRHRLVQYQVLHKWSQELHQQFPERFKEAVRLLLAASRVSPASQEPLHPTGYQTGLWSLPKEVLTLIFALAALPVTLWV